jgi:poly(3-hydroxyalkanoate) synthetase
MPSVADYPLIAFGLLWPAFVAEQASELAGAVAHGLIDLAGGPHDESNLVEPEWITQNEVALELASVRLRRFGKSGLGRPTLICAPFALHAATITDIAPGHSLVEALGAVLDGPVYVTDWRSADANSAFRTIDDYIADLNVLIGELGESVDLVGLCQGGWMGLAYAARFPGKVRRLVLAGAPIDIAAADSALSRLARSTPLAVFQELVTLGGGRMQGRRLLKFWQSNAINRQNIQLALQIPSLVGAEAFRPLESRFREWYAWTLDLPGRFYLDVIERIYLKNELAAGYFSVLGRRLDLGDVTIPIYLLAASEDDVVAPAQALAVRNLVGTKAPALRYATTSCGHLGLFMGRRTLADEWREIGRWLMQSDATTARASQPSPIMTVG